MSTEQSKMRAREWLLIIIAIIIGEYLFIEKVFKYGADQGIVGYISFAGTIVSIILAVLAIVYSYYQNFAQQRDSRNISTQIDLLRATVTDVRLSKAEFTDDLKRMSEISDKLDQSLSIIGESKTQVAQLTSNFESFRKSLENSPVEDSSRAALNVGTQLDPLQFFDQLGDGIKSILYGLYASRNAEISDASRARQYAELANKAWTADLTRINMGALIATETIFINLRLIRKSGLKLLFDSSLEKFIVENVENGIKILDDRNRAIVQNLKSYAWRT